jgi:hypothetical protein
VPAVDVPHERRVDVVAEQFLQPFRQPAPGAVARFVGKAAVTEPIGSRWPSP